MSFFQLESLLAEQKNKNILYHEFLRVQSMSAGIYSLKAGQDDLQNPHTEDEIYYVVQGKSQFNLEGENTAVSAGSIIFVPKNLKHRFHTIEEDLTVLVLFSPAEHTLNRQITNEI